jgi:hypothetical protein
MECLQTPYSKSFMDCGGVINNMVGCIEKQDHVMPENHRPAIHQFYTGQDLRRKWKQLILIKNTMSVLLSDEELEALSGITDIQYRLYISGIRRYMDYKTGITGIKRKISYQSLSEEIYIEPIKGVKNTGSKSRQQIRRAVKSLEKSGLIAIKSTSENLILNCLLAKTDLLHSKQGRHKADTLADTQADTPEESKNPVKIDTLESAPPKSRHTGRHTQNAQADIPPLSDRSHNITLPSKDDFLNLLAQQGYYINQLHGNKNTLAMVKVWMDAKVTLEEAQNGIKHANTIKPPRPDTPYYYLKPVLQVRKDFEKAQQQANEVSNETNKRTNRNPERKQKSNTHEMWDETLAALRGHYEPEDN